ncbi:hypothetical protein BGZ93_003052 [Podila epicladia]|nr:hypothetical protein BGZ93_003052 [Podila epicladia]
MLFGWMEQVFDGNNDSIVEVWHKTCMEEMPRYDPDEIRADDVFLMAKTNIPAAQTGLEQSTHTDTVAFLKLMVCMRRVIIQDAVLCLQPVPGTGRTLSNSLIEKLPEVFQSQLFMDYSRELLQAIERHREAPATIDVGIHVDGSVIIEAINRPALQQTVLNRILTAMEAKHHKQLELQEEQHAQAMAAQIVQYKQLQEAHKDVLTAFKEFKVMQQQLLVQYSQHPHLHPPPPQHPHLHPQPPHHHAPRQQQQQQAPQAPHVPFNYTMRPDRVMGGNAEETVQA